jgi:aminoglycoside 3'-phosphotransferase-2
MCSSDIQEGGFDLGLLPGDLRNEIGATASWERVPAGRSGALVFRVRAHPDGSARFLKIAPSGHCRELRRENEALKCLRAESFALAPRPILFAVTDQHEFLLATEVPGTDLESVGALEPDRIVECAKLLRAVHAISTETCKLDQRLDVKLEWAKYRVEANVVDETDFDPERAGMSAADVFAALQRSRPKEEDLVFTHGDFTPANILFVGRDPSGLVDWGRAGIADRYQDLALFCRALPSEERVALFLSSYGIAEPDPTRLGYYQLLDEMF